MEIKCPNLWYMYICILVRCIKLYKYMYVGVRVCIIQCDKCTVYVCTYVCIVHPESFYTWYIHLRTSPSFIYCAYILYIHTSI